MNKNIIWLLLSGLFLSAPLWAEVARIKDKDGFTNVRSGEGTGFPVIGTLDSTDLFYCERSTDEWIKITALTKHTVNGLIFEGYMHKSRIEFLADIDNDKKKELLEKTFNTYQKLVIQLQQLIDAEDYDKANEFQWQPSIYSDAVYSSVLEILPSYLKQTKDTATLQFFLTPCG